MSKQSQIDQLIFMFSKLPGLGPRSARRLILHLLQDKDSRIPILINGLTNLYNSIKKCGICQNYDTISPCNICADNNRDKAIIAIVETVADLWALERSGMYKGLYHVLGGTLSATSKVGPKDPGVSKIKERVIKGSIKEIIIATNSTLEGHTTAFYLMENLKDKDIKISRLASGIPIGGELDYLDDGTLGAAIYSRQSFEG